MDVWSWSSPLGLGAFIVGIALAISLLSWSIHRMASIDAPRSNSRRGR